MAVQSSLHRPIIVRNVKNCEKSIRKLNESLLLIFCIACVLLTNKGFLFNSVDALEHHHLHHHRIGKILVFAQNQLIEILQF
jgi:hypothetical protein